MTDPFRSVLSDERSRFEQWAREDSRLTLDLAWVEVSDGPERIGWYRSIDTHRAWAGWKARAETKHWPPQATCATCKWFRPECEHAHGMMSVALCTREPQEWPMHWRETWPTGEVGPFCSSCWAILESQFSFTKAEAERKLTDEGLIRAMAIAFGEDLPAMRQALLALLYDEKRQP